jgi:hypothetical protein
MRNTQTLFLLMVIAIGGLVLSCSGEEGPSLEELRALGSTNATGSFEEFWDLRLFKTDAPEQKRGSVLILEADSQYQHGGYRITTGLIEGPNLIPVSFHRGNALVWKEWLPPTWLYFPDGSNHQFYVLIYDFLGDQGLKEILLVDLQKGLTQGLRINPTIFPDNLENRDFFYATDINFDWSNALVVSFGVNYRKPTNNPGINEVWERQLGDLLGKDSPLDLGYWVVRSGGN